MYSGGFYTVDNNKNITNKYSSFIELRSGGGLIRMEREMNTFRVEQPHLNEGIET